MKYLILLLVFPYLTFAQDITNSIGVVTLANNDTDLNTNIELHNADGSIWHTLHFGRDNLNRGITYPETFKPLILNERMAALVVICADKDTSGYTVYVNKPDSLLKKIPVDQHVQFQTWETYVLSKSIQLNNELNVIYDSPNGELVKLENTNTLDFLPVKIEGDWLQVKWDITPHLHNTPTFRYGWIKWQENGRIIISLSY